MSVASAVKAQIAEFPKGYVFSCRDFAAAGNTQTVILALSRLAKAGEIKRLSKGKYYVPQKTQFGELMPANNDIIATIVTQNDGYLGDLSALNKMGVTTQIPSEITVRGCRSSRKLRVGNIRFNLVRSDTKVASPSESKLTNILETMRLFKRIPAGDPDLTVRQLRRAVEDLDPKELSRISNLSFSYRPYVRAFLGALFEELDIPYWKSLKEGLNPVTIFRLKISDEQLPTRSNWNIQ